ncbi:Na(+)/H(+) exchange regulatory cofactor NHE-RF1 isoform X3 [Lingula anatina]|uniref:Na(+)/H(+) exchange regulatory cofactor NHE-RF1 isoform X3 n=1 Tax=Lingula anatina TaxID=7574 RepID=A0A1S3HT03_LINAN|nr:Na(+)/H(+) exchange regulatory cofactor NHE-RF1 isoform X3 [Lingula anatina]|eukprot:XP_013388184.1 Na(+)/H(+) exchange regulatory cofactor NHE-RF1 isoform X3 [Lingula anatina]
MSSYVPEDAPQVRLCHLRKWSDFNGYGFNLHAEKGKAGQYIGKVDPDSPAEAARLKEGDRIVEVNGVNIGNENHQQVVSRVKAGGDETRLLVVDAEADNYYKEHKIVIRNDLPSVVVFATPADRNSKEPSTNGDAGEVVTNGTAAVIAAETSHTVESHEDEVEDLANDYEQVDISPPEEQKEPEVEEPKHTEPEPELPPEPEPEPPVETSVEAEVKAEEPVQNGSAVQEDHLEVENETGEQEVAEEVAEKTPSVHSEQEEQKQLSSDSQSEKEPSVHSDKVSPEPEPEPVEVVQDEEPQRDPTPPPPPPAEPEPEPEPEPAPVVEPPPPEPVHVEEPAPVKAAAPQPPAPSPQANGDTLNLPMSAKEMREMLKKRKKADPKSQHVPFQKKNEMFQRL